MNKQKNSKKQNTAAQKKKKIAAISVILILAAVVLFVVGTRIFAQNTGSASTGSVSVALNQRKPAITDQDLVIQIADITENALFFPVNIDGLRMEVLAVRAPDGTVRTAFNTCQVCYASGRGNYVQEGSLLVCQNCGNRYRMSQVERQAGGCNPVPIFAANKTETTETITISIAHFRETRAIFERWR